MINVAKVIEYRVYREFAYAPSWFFVKTGHKETSHVNFVVIFEISTKFRLKNNAPSIKNEKKVVIGPPLVIYDNTDYVYREPNV